VGQVAARLHRLGAQVIGVDRNEELLKAARTRYPEVRFEKLDLGELTPASFGQVDGVWASFVAAYLPNLDSAVARWSDCVVPGGWVALVEMDDLFGHLSLKEPFSTLWHHRFIDHRRGSSSLLLIVHPAKAEPYPATLGQRRPKPKLRN
jgi:trans-aconitate methyltransferase